MPAWEDLDAFLADFGLPCVAGVVSFTGILDQPDEVLNLTHADALSREYDLTYKTAAVTLTRGGALTVDGVAFTVREAPRQIDDGAFTRARLSKT